MSHKKIFTFFALLCGFFGLGLLAVTFEPFGRVQLFAQHFSSTGRADSFSPAVWSKILPLLDTIGVVFLLLSASLLFKSEQIIQKTTLTMDLYQTHWRELLSDARRFLKNHQRSLVFVSILTILGACFRLKFLFSPMRYDETFNFYYFVKRPFISIFSDYMLPNNHVLYTAIVRLVYLLLGSAEWALRLPCFIFGVAVIPAAWVAITLMSGPRVALWATALISSSSFLIEYSSNSRGYMLALFLGFAVFSLAAYVKKKNNSAAWLLLAVCSALGLLTITTMLFEVAAVFLWLLFSVPTYSRRTFLLQGFKAGLLLSVLTILFYLPILIFTGSDALLHNPIMAPMPFARFLPEVPTFLRNCWLSWNRDYPSALKWLLSIGLIFQVFQPKRAQVFYALALSAGVILFSMRHPPFIRVWIYLLPFYLAAGMSWLTLLPRFMDGRVAQSCAVIFGLLTAYPIVTKGAVDFGPPGDSVTLQDGRQIAEDLQSLVHPGDMIFSPFPDDMPMLYYLDRARIKNVLSPEPHSDRIFLVQTLTGSDLSETLSKSNSTVWAKYTAPSLIRSYAHTLLYEVHLKEVKSSEQN